jgi:hypothetical protein
MIEAMRLKIIVRSPWNSITSLPDYQAVQKLLVGDRQTGDLISLFSFLENRLKKCRTEITFNGMTSLLNFINI